MAIRVEGLVRHFRVARRPPGVRAAVRALGRRHYETIPAVVDVSFRVDAGEVVGFLGPNGAGKTTTLKCLAGLLHPTGGTVRVLGHRPQERRRDFLSRIALVMGQRNQLFWDLPAMETFLVNQSIYQVPDAGFRTALDELVALLSLEHLLDKQVRTLSLGERMRCELAAALLHRPDVLFLDEPTLGLDVEGQQAVRRFLRNYNARHGATILLTSHYMGDVTALSERVLVIAHGRLRYDGALRALVERTAPYRVLRLTLSARVGDDVLAQFGERVDLPEGSGQGSADGAVALRVPRARTREIAGRALSELPVVDLAIEEPPIEDVVREVFAQQ